MQTYELNLPEGFSSDRMDHLILSALLLAIKAIDRKGEKRQPLADRNDMKAIVDTNFGENKQQVYVQPSASFIWPPLLT